MIRTLLKLPVRAVKGIVRRVLGRGRPSPEAVRPAVSDPWPAPASAAAPADDPWPAPASASAPKVEAPAAPPAPEPIPEVTPAAEAAPSPVPEPAKPKAKPAKGKGKSKAKAAPALHAEETPNPLAMKFTSEGKFRAKGSASYVNAAVAKDDPLAAALFAVVGVKQVFIATGFVTVTRATNADWAALQPQIEAVLTEALAG